MNSPRERYQSDPDFRTLVDTMTAMIHQAKFTPSEMRTAAVLASIIYEETHIRDSLLFPTSVVDWLNGVEKHDDRP